MQEEALSDCTLVLYRVFYIPYLIRYNSPSLPRNNSALVALEQNNKSSLEINRINFCCCRCEKDKLFALLYHSATRLGDKMGVTEVVELNANVNGWPAK